MIDEYLHKISDFIIKYSPYTDKKLLEQYIEEHLKYKTCFVGIDSLDNVVFFCRWNIENGEKENEQIANILDLYIKEEYRGKKIIQQMLARGVWLFPQVKKIKFERFMKYGGRKSEIPVEKILKERK